VVATSAVRSGPDIVAYLTEGTEWNFNWIEVSDLGFKNEIWGISINWNKIGIEYINVILRSVRVTVVAV
jgi:hypothetical protein